MIYVILPVYNEAGSISELLKCFQEWLNSYHEEIKILVIDDGSSDTSVSEIETYLSTLPIKFIKHKQNQGLGSTVKDGLEFCCQEGKPDDIIVTMDADNTHHPQYIADLVSKIHSGYDLVIASRYEAGGQEIGVAWYRRLISRLGSTLIRVVFSLPNKDLTCGFRAYRLKVIKDGFQLWGNNFIKERNFSYILELTLKLANFDLKITEIPFILRYDQKQSASKMPLFQTIWRDLKLLIKLRKKSKLN